jgi:hypothetical protein
MAKVKTKTDYIDIESDNGHCEGVEVTCEKCGHSELSGGTHDGSLSQCAFLLRENCPQKENNFYIVEPQ